MTVAPMQRIHWHNGRTSRAPSCTAWLEAARDADVPIPTGCLGGSCGACELEVNGSVVRACIETVPETSNGELWVEIAVDPHW